MNQVKQCHKFYIFKFSLRLLLIPSIPPLSRKLHNLGYLKGMFCSNLLFIYECIKQYMIYG